MATDDAWEGWAVYPWESRGDTRPLAVTRERDDADWFDTGPGSTEVRRVLVILRDPGADDTEAMLAARVKELEGELESSQGELKGVVEDSERELRRAQKEHAKELYAAECERDVATRRADEAQTEIERLQDELAALRNAAPD